MDVHRLRLFHHFQQRLEVLFRRRHSCQLGRDATILDMVHELLRVFALLARLLGEESGEAFKTPAGAPDGHGEIGMGGGQFVINLAVEFRQRFGRNFVFGHKIGLLASLCRRLARRASAALAGLK